MWEVREKIQILFFSSLLPQATNLKGVWEIACYASMGGMLTWVACGWYACMGGVGGLLAWKAWFLCYCGWYTSVYGVGYVCGVLG